MSGSGWNLGLLLAKLVPQSSVLYLLAQSQVPVSNKFLIDRGPGPTSYRTWDWFVWGPYPACAQGSFLVGFGGPYVILGDRGPVRQVPYSLYHLSHPNLDSNTRFMAQLCQFLTMQHRVGFLQVNRGSRDPPWQNYMENEQELG